MRKIQVGGHKRRNGVKNIKWALVDDSDFDKLNKYVWTLTFQGYAHRRELIGGRYKHIYMHRQILDTKDGLLTDHINRKRLDNRRNNLRICKSSENGFNKGLRSDNSSGTTGVYWQSKRNNWLVQITTFGKTINLGRFKSKRKAIMIRKEAEKKYFGNYAIVSV